MFKELKRIWKAAKAWTKELFDSGSFKSANRAAKNSYNRSSDNLMDIASGFGDGLLHKGSKAAKKGAEVFKKTAKKAGQKLEQEAEELLGAKSQPRRRVGGRKDNVESKQFSRQKAVRKKTRAANEAKREGVRKKWGVGKGNKSKGVNRV